MMKTAVSTWKQNYLQRKNWKKKALKQTTINWRTIIKIAYNFKRCKSSSSPSSSSSYHGVGPLVARSGLKHLEVSLRVSPGFFRLLVCSFLVFSVIYYGAFCLYGATIFFCKPTFCPKLALYLVLLQSRCLFYNQFKCVHNKKRCT